MAKGKRVTIAPNIYRYPDEQLEAVVSVTGCPRRHKRFQADTRIAVIRDWVVKTRQEMSDDLRAAGGLSPVDRRRGVGSLETDAPAWYRQISGRASARSDLSHLRAWFTVVVDGKRLGSIPRSAWTTRHVNEAIAQWQTKPSPHAVRTVHVRGYARPEVEVRAFTMPANTVRAHDRVGRQTGAVSSYDRGPAEVSAHRRPEYSVPGYTRVAPATSGIVVAPRTIRHRCRVLADVYHTLDGKKAPTPVDDAKIPKQPKTPPVTLPAHVIETTLTNLARLDPPTFGRFAVHATTGQRPCQIGRARPDDLQLDARLWLVRDAKGEPGHTITLDDPQIAAWEAFVAANAWGEIDTSKYGKIIHKAGWPKGIRPYAARHSIAVDAIRKGVSLGDVQAMLGHADPTTTRIYAPFVVDRQRAVSHTMRGYLADAFKLRLVKG